MRMRKAMVLGLVIAMSLLTIGCGSRNKNSNGGSTSTDATASASVKGDKSDSSDKSDNSDKEDKVTSDANKDERVVASSVAVVQVLDALGVPMVGVPTSSYELPESVADATRIGNAMTPDMEVIASLEPTVVISVDSLSADLKAQFDTLNIESQFVNLDSYAGLKETITTLGERFQVADKAEELLKSFEEREKAVASSIEGKEAPSVLIIFGAGSSFMVASEDSYVGNLASLVGANNIITDAKASFTPVDMEYLADKNPDYILFMAHANPADSLKAFEEEFASNQAWQNFKAVKEGNVFALETSYFGMSANLLAVDAMEKLAKIVYGE